MESRRFFPVLTTLFPEPNAYSFLVAGTGFVGPGVDPVVEGEFFTRLRDSLMYATKLRFYGLSKRSGRSIQGLEQAWRFRKRDLGDAPSQRGRRYEILPPRLGGELGPVVVFDAKTGEVAPELI